ncbi:MAG TPA: EF-hand domain-containing protein [Sphingomonas sp.]
MVVWLGLMLMASAQDVPPSPAPTPGIKPLAGQLPPDDTPVRRPGAPADRPRGRLFISPMGEPFRGADPVGAWFDGADTNHDGVLTLAEFIADADRFFMRLDRGHDGEIDPDDIDYYETVLAPEIRTGGEMAGGGRPGGGGSRRGGGRGGGRRGGSEGGGRMGSRGPGGEGGGSDGGASPRYADVKRGAARFSFFDYPEPVTIADTNFNRGVDPKEFRDAAVERFAMLDTNHDGKLTRAELPRLNAPTMGQWGKGRKGRRGSGGRWQGGDRGPDRGAPSEGGGDGGDDSQP